MMEMKYSYNVSDICKCRGTSTECIYFQQNLVKYNREVEESHTLYGTPCTIMGPRAEHLLLWVPEWKAVFELVSYEIFMKL